MKCPLCGRDFREEDSASACRGCPMARGSCHMVRCPNCGYETPMPPKLKVPGIFRRMTGGLKRKG